MNSELPFNTRAVIAQILTLGPSYGVGVIELIAARTGVRLSQGSIYPALAGLERDGLIRRRSSLRRLKDLEREERWLRRPQRKGIGVTAVRTVYFELTAQGKRFVKRQREMIVALLEGGEQKPVSDGCVVEEQEEMSDGGEGEKTSEVGGEGESKVVGEAGAEP